MEAIKKYAILAAFVAVGTLIGVTILGAKDARSTPNT